MELAQKCDWINLDNAQKDEEYQYRIRENGKKNDSLRDKYNRTRKNLPKKHEQEKMELNRKHLEEFRQLNKKYPDNRIEISESESFKSFKNFEYQKNKRTQQQSSKTGDLGRLQSKKSVVGRIVQLEKSISKKLGLGF